MTFLKKSLAMLLVFAMMIGSMSIAASAWHQSTDDGNSIDFVHEFYRYDETEGKWVLTTKAKPGEVVKVRVTVTTDYYTNHSSAAIMFDNRFFTILDNAGKKPNVAENFKTGTNSDLGAVDNNSMWYTKDTANYVVKNTLATSDKVDNYLNGVLVETTDSEGNKTTKVPLADFAENYNFAKSSIAFQPVGKNLMLDGSAYLYEYQFEVKDTPVVRTPGNKGTVLLPKEIASDYDVEEGIDLTRFFDFPKGSSSSYSSYCFGLEWTPEITSNIATISVFGDITLDANGGTFASDDGPVKTRTSSGIIGDTAT